jgi:hypothetical protein
MVGLSGSLTNLATVLNELGDHDGALARLDEVIRISPEVGDPIGKAFTISSRPTSSATREIWIARRLPPKRRLRSSRSMSMSTASAAR